MPRARAAAFPWTWRLRRLCRGLPTTCFGPRLPGCDAMAASPPPLWHARQRLIPGKSTPVARGSWDGERPPDRGALRERASLRTPLPLPHAAHRPTPQ
eukprot:3022125-Pleurochrysis_carterae.AAC.4